MGLFGARDLERRARRWWWFGRRRWWLDGYVPAPSRWRHGLLAQLPWRWRLILRLPLYIGAALAAGIASLLVYYSMVYPDPMAIAQRERSPVIRILARDGSLLAERGTTDDYLPIDLIPAHVRNAVVATEDHRFWQHWGLDPWGVFRATLTNLRAGRLAQGGSTLTQQLAKNVFLGPERTMERKVEELLLALWLEARLSKPEILELYLNRVYFGAGAYGIEAAARRYFAKSARDLNVAEAAVIAGLLKAPSRYSPATSAAAARARGRVVIERMRSAGVITEQEAETAAATSVKFATGETPTITGYEYAIDYILERLPRLVGIGHTSLVVETTIDMATQRTAQQRLTATLSNDLKQGPSQGAAVVLDNDGGIAALVGGRSWAESQFNRAVRSQRQPGSAWKPIVYLTAIEAGMKPDHVVTDAPTSINGWSPRNDDGLYRGRIDLRRALAASVNTIAVRLQIELGASRVIETARRLGIVSEIRPGPSMALGTSEVTPLEIATAYAALANGGIAVRPYVIRRVRMPSGRIVYTRPEGSPHRVIAPDHVAAMNDLLRYAVENGTGRRARLSAHAVAGKTGTTQDYRDAWFVGFTAHRTAAVWLGNDNGWPMERIAGGTLPAEAWRAIMTAAHAGLPSLPLAGLSRERKPEATSSKADRPSALSGPVLARLSSRHELEPRGRIADEFVSKTVAEETLGRHAPAAAVGRLAGFPPGRMSLGAPETEAQASAP